MKQTMFKNGVDSHFHIFNMKTANAELQSTRYTPQYSARLTDWQALSQAAGITHGVLVQPSFLGIDNQLMFAALKAHSDTLRGVAVVGPDIISEELQVWHVAGVRGLRLNLVGKPHHIPEWTQADTIWNAIRELGWHVELHTDTGALPEVLAQVPSDIPLVIDHMGKPDTLQASDATVAALVQRAKQTKVHVKLSGAYRLNGLDATQLAHIWLNELGATSLVWGSDWPCTNHESLANYDALRGSLNRWIGHEWIDQVLIHNPMRLYWGLTAQ